MAKLQTLVAAMIFRRETKAPQPAPSINGVALAVPQGGPIEGLTSCFTYTTTVPYTKPHSCPLQTICPVHPHCLVLEVSTITVPAPNKLCPTTPTVTATGSIACPTCQQGCVTRLETVITTLAA